MTKKTVFTGAYTSAGAAVRAIEARSLRHPGAAPPAARLGLRDADVPRALTLAPTAGEAGALTLDQIYSVDAPTDRRLLPQQVEVRAGADGRTIVAEFFPDRGSCSEHPIGILREVPIDAKTGKPQRSKTVYLRVGSSDAFEKAIAAFNKKRWADAFRLMGHALAWSGMMRFAVTERVGRALADPAYKRKLARVRVKEGVAVGLFAEPHPEGQLLTQFVGTGGEDLLRLVAVDPADPTYRRVAPDGAWDLVVHATSMQVGFVARTPDLTEIEPAPKG